MQRQLNLDIPGAVSEFEMLLKKVLPKNIWYKIILGKGLEFDGYRDFTFSDDADLIDWKATVRAQKTLVKKYIEERDLKFMLIVDVSDNMIFGSTEKLKCEYCAELCAALSHLILISGDRAGFVLFNDGVVKIGLPKQGTKQFDIFVHELSDPFNYGGISDLNLLLENLMKTLDSSISLVFLISDFVRVDDSYKKNIEILSSLFETVAIFVRDPLDVTLPEINKEVVIESSDGSKLLINPKVAKNLYEKNALEQVNFVKSLFRENNIDFLELLTNESFPEKFADFLKQRIERGRMPRKNVY